MGALPEAVIDRDRTFDRSLQQRRDALEGANVIRCARAQLKRDVKAGRRDALSAVLYPPSCAQSMHVIDLLLAVPKVGRVNANRILVRCRIAPSKTLAGLSERQRQELAAEFAARRV